MSFRNIFLFFFSLLSFFLFLIALFEYEGNKLYYIIFSLISYIYLVYLTNKNSFFYENFISVFLFAGFWFNFTIKINFLDSLFPEGVGFFDYEPSSYDEVMIVCSISFISIIFSSFIRRKIFTGFTNHLVKPKFTFHPKSFFTLFILFLIFVILISYLNYNFSIYQRSFTSKIELNFFITNFFKWFFLIGCSTFCAYFINLYINQTKKLPKKIIIIHIFIEFIINLSMLSRGMVFNSISIAWGIFKKTNFKKHYIFNSIYLILIIALFILGIKVVGDLRLKNKTLQISANCLEIKKIDDKRTMNSLKIAKSSFNNSDTPIQNKYVRILLSRLIGIEGVMAVQSLDNKGYALILESLKENPSLEKGNSFFDSLKKEQRCSDEFSKSITLPGIVAFLYYSGSLVFVSISLIIINFFMCLIEKIMRILLGDQLLFISLVSQILAYRMWHFGFAPLNSIKLLLAIFSTIFLVYLINKFFKIKQ